MLAQHAGDVIVDHDHLVDMTVPLRREHADGGRPAAHPHPPFHLAIHDRGFSGLHQPGQAARDEGCEMPPAGQLSVADIQLLVDWASVWGRGC